MHIAVLGAGLSGLSAAFHVARRFPSAALTVVEKQPLAGGWVRSTRLDVSDGRRVPSSIVLEAGPRTLRPNAKSVLELINLLSLSDSVITTPKSAPAAKNRFLHIPGTQGLVALPSSISSFLASPLRSLLLPAILKEPFLPRNRPSGCTDESFDAVFTRRFGKPFARTMGSALIHGIYAADSRKLSIRAAFPSLWEAEDRGRGSLVRGMVLPRRPKPQKEDYELASVPDMMKDVSVYSFRDGMSTLTRALECELKSKPNIRLLYDTGIESLSVNPTDKSFSIHLSSGQHLTPTHIVSALPLPILHTILSSRNDPSIIPPHLTANPSSTVTVINLVFPPTPPNQPPIHPPGFGYLVPRPKLGYEDSKSNELGILGVVFDSCALSAQDFARNSLTLGGGSSAPTESSSLTKLTVMLGGPYAPHLTSAIPSTPSLLAQLSKHLSLPHLPEPLAVHAHVNKDCIPLYGVGHLDRVREMKMMLDDGPWEGRMEIVGAGVGGVSVGDCIEAGRKVGKRWVV